MHIQKLLAASAAVVGLLIQGAAWSAPRFELVDVGPATRIGGFNDRGELVGTDAADNLFTYKRGIRSALPVPFDILNQCTFTSISFGAVYPVGINNAGEIVIGIIDSPDFFASCVVVFRDGTFTLVGVAGRDAVIVGPDAAGEILADDFTSIGFIGGEFFGPSAPCALPVLPPGAVIYTRAFFGISERGNVAGSVLFLGSASNNPAAMACAKGRMIIFPSLAGESRSQADTINNFGVAAGFIDSHAALFEEHRSVDLGAQFPELAISSTATDINDWGQIVGVTAPDKFTSAIAPFLFECGFRGGSVHLLQDLIEEHDPLRGYVQLLNNPLINNRGEIAVTGIDSRTDAMHAYILRPRDLLDRNEQPSK